MESKETWSEIMVLGSRSTLLTVQVALDLDLSHPAESPVNNSIHFCFNTSDALAHSQPSDFLSGRQTTVQFSSLP